jgi:hypothetical protein
MEMEQMPELHLVVTDNQVMGEKEVFGALRNILK